MKNEIDKNTQGKRGIRLWKLIVVIISLGLLLGYVLSRLSRFRIA